MALADVKIYYKQVEEQWLEAKADLADFEKALKDGYITEDRLTDAIEEFNVLDDNYMRLSYIMHLFAIPNRHSRSLSKADKKLADTLSLLKVTDDYVIQENADALVRLRAELDKLTKEAKQQ